MNHAEYRGQKAGQSEPPADFKCAAAALGGQGGHSPFIGVFVFALMVTLAFIRPLISLASHAAATELNSHILLIPFISAYLLCINRRALSREYSRAPVCAAIFAGIGLLALAAAMGWRASSAPPSQNDFLALMTLSFVSVQAAGGFFFLGRAWMVSAAFPIAFLLFMVPLPDFAVERLETASKLASAEAANAFFELSGTPVLRDGTIFALPGIVIEVARECSGIRSSWVLLITSLLASHMFLTSRWRQAVLVAVVIPLGILRNGFRILVIGLLCVNIGPQMIHSIVHKRGGPFFFALSLIPLFLLLIWLRRGEMRKGNLAPGSKQAGAGKLS